MKFDLTVTNPPYNSNLDIKILNALYDSIEEVICVHPSCPYNDIRTKRNFIKTFKKSFNFMSIEFFNVNEIFNTCMFAQGIIFHSKISYKEKIINVNCFGEEYFSNNINDVNKFSKEWVSIVKPFYLKMKDYTKEDNIQLHFKDIKNIKDINNISQISLFRGHVLDLPRIRGNIIQISMMRANSSLGSPAPDFYTLVMRDSNKNKGIRKIREDGKECKNLIEVNNQIELDNLIRYLKTDFVRFCLSIYKTNGAVLGGISALIPWLDFSQSWDDEKLFKHFEIDQETRNYIRKFLPDYYGIRK